MRVPTPTPTADSPLSPPLPPSPTTRTSPRRDSTEHLSPPPRSPVSTLTRTSPRRDSTEHLSPPSRSPVSTLTRTASSLSRTASSLKLLSLTPLRRRPSPPPPALWPAVLASLSADDLRPARTALRQLRNHRGASPLHLARAHTLRALLCLLPVWHAHDNLAPAVARTLAAAVHTGSRDAAALATWLWARGRWTPPDLGAAEELVCMLEAAAERGHSTSQAVLGALLCRVSPFDGGDVSRGGASYPREPDLERGAAWLRAAAAQGHFLALHTLELAVQKGCTPSEGLVTGEVEECALPPMAADEFFALVQSGANRRVPDCGVRMAKLLRKGLGCARSEEEARCWVREAATLNLPGAVSAAWREAVGENLEISERVAKGGKFGSGIGRRVRANRDVVAECQRRMTAWRESGVDGRVVLTLHRICNLTGKVAESAGEALLRVVFERDRDGWTCGE